MSRRSLLARAVGVAGASALAACAGAHATALTGAVPEGLPRGPRRRVARVAHLTDLHVMRSRRAAEGISAALRHVNGLADKPDLIVTGGDLCHAGMSATREDFGWMIGELRRAFAGENQLPVEHCLGNHDIWGWAKSRSGATGSEADYGKRWSQEAWGLGELYRRRTLTPRGDGESNDAWELIVLDSVQPAGEDYIGALDPTGGEKKQYAWLEAELAKIPRQRPVLVVTHIPILSISAYAHDARRTEDGFRVGSGAVMQDANELLALFARYPNVRLALSGHIHAVERVDFDGVTYVCSGAVSGAWWRQPEADRERRARQRQEDVPRPLRSTCGYMVVDLLSDGTFVHEYVTFPFELSSEQ